MDELKEKEELSKEVELRQNKYLNNRIEQNHRFIKRLVKPGMGFGSFNTARRTIRGYEIMNMIRKGQIQGLEKEAVRERVLFMHQICRSGCIVNSSSREFSILIKFLQHNPLPLGAGREEMVALVAGSRLRTPSPAHQ
jgi:hypothetical protein